MSGGDEQRHVVIAGGGITGLSAAYYVKKLCAEQAIPVRITLLERSERLGGKISTLRKDGHVIERGPDSFLSRKPAIIELSRDLGMEPELVATNPEAKRTFILHKGKLHRTPPGMVLGIPTQLTPFMKTELISPAGKARAAMDLILPRRKGSGDESIGSFIRRRLGSEVLDYMAEPILAGIYSGDTNILSIQATFPQFHETERKHRSLILGMMKGSGRAPAAAPSGPPLPAPIKQSMFLSYRLGLGALIERLQESLSDIEITTNEEAVRIEASHTRGRYTLHTSGGKSLEADAVVLAVPAYTLGELLPSLSSAQVFARMPYISVANVVFGYARSAVTHPLDGSGFVIPRKEKRFITACTWTSSKWGHTAPRDRVLLRCYVGRSGEEDWVRLTDEQIIAKVKQEVRELSGIEAEPDFVEVTRHMRSMPQYEVGHLDRIKALRDEMSTRTPGVWATGSAFDGVGIPDCIRQGKEAATALLERLKR